MHSTHEDHPGPETIHLKSYRSGHVQQFVKHKQNLPNVYPKFYESYRRPSVSYVSAFYLYAQRGLTVAYKTVLMCVMSSLRHNCSKTSSTNYGPLFDTICRSVPFLEIK